MYVYNVEWPSDEFHIYLAGNSNKSEYFALDTQCMLSLLPDKGCNSVQGQPIQVYLDDFHLIPTAESTTPLPNAIIILMSCLEAWIILFT